MRSLSDRAPRISKTLRLGHGPRGCRRDLGPSEIVNASLRSDDVSGACELTSACRFPVTSRAGALLGHLETNIEEDKGKADHPAKVLLRGIEVPVTRGMVFLQVRPEMLRRFRPSRLSWRAARDPETHLRQGGRIVRRSCDIRLIYLLITSTLRRSQTGSEGSTLTSGYEDELQNTERCDVISLPPVYAGEPSRGTTHDIIRFPSQTQEASCRDSSGSAAIPEPSGAGDRRAHLSSPLISLAWYF